MPSAEQVLNRARSQLGRVESPPGSNRIEYNDWYYGNATRAPWCATWLSWCFFHEGLPLPATNSRGFAYTPSGAQWFKNRGKWMNNHSPDVRPGDVVFFYWPSMGRIAHVGVVEAVRPNGDVVTIEGNTDESGGRSGGKVMRRVRSRATVNARGGFGRPDFTQAPSPSPDPQPGSAPPFPGTIKRGDTGPNVRTVQERLNAHSPSERDIQVDGDFGPLTETRVKQFQAAKGLQQVGYVGPKTWAALHN